MSPRWLNSLFTSVPLRLWPMLVTVVLSLVGCAHDDNPPQLLQLTDVTPRVLDANEYFEVAGVGLPVKSRAQVTLVGSVHRPGHTTLKKQRIELVGDSDGTRISARLDEDARSRFVGKNDEGLHTTFRGALHVSFAPVTPGALPVTGSLNDVVLDIRPVGVRPSLVQSRVAEGERALKWLGLTVVDEPVPSGGLVVSDVANASPAEASGIVVGDTIVAVDGVTLLEVADVAPTGKDRFALLSVRNGNGKDVTEKLVALSGYKPVTAGTPDLLGVGLVLGAASLIILFAASPGAQWLTRLERRVAAYATQRKAGRSLLAWLFERSTTAIRTPRAELSVARSSVASAVFMALSALLVLLPFGSLLLGLELDVGSLLAGVVVFQTTLHFTQRAQALPNRRPGWFRTLMRSLFVSLPSVVATACAALSSSAFHIRDLVRAQGALPWQWSAFRSPMNWVLMALVLLPSFIEARTSQVPEAQEDPTSRRKEVSMTLQAMQVGLLFLLSGICTAVFLGGWNIPGIETAQQERSLSWQIVGAVLLLAKTWGLVGLLSVLRAVTPRVPLEHSAGVLFRRVVPVLLFTCGLCVLWMFYEPAPFVRQVVAASMLGFTIALSVHLVSRIANSIRSTRGPGHVNPFI